MVLVIASGHDGKMSCLIRTAVYDARPELHKEAPEFGYLSARTVWGNAVQPNRNGRRRPWIAFGPALLVERLGHRAVIDQAHAGQQ